MATPELGVWTEVSHKLILTHCQSLLEAKFSEDADLQEAEYSEEQLLEATD